MNPTLTRRAFLQFSAAACAATTLAPALVPAAESAAKKRPLRKAIMYATIGFKGSVLEKFQAIKAAGFDGVEPMSHMNVDEVLKALEATGLKAASVCCATHWDKPLSDPNPAVREAGLNGLNQALREAKRYGATAVLLVPGVVKAPVTYDECWQRSIAEIRKALPLAAELGVKIAIENVWNNFITRPEQAAGYVDELNSPWVGWYFDIGNVIKFSPPEQWVPVLGQRIVRLHFKEYSKAKGFGVKFFDGDNRWPAIMEAVDRAGYQGWAISEQPSEQTRDAAGLQDFAARMDRILAS